MFCKSVIVKKPVVNSAGFFFYINCMDGNQKGCFAEYHFAATAISLGFNVSTPLLSASYYDCILEKDGKLFKIQVKFLGKDRRKNKNSVQITLRRTGLPSYQKKICRLFCFVG